MNYLIAFFLLIAISACGKSDQTKAEREYLARKDAQKARFDNGAYISKEKQISTTETVRVVILPSKVDDFLDVKCVLYTNAEFKVAQMQCPDISTLDFDE